MLSDCGKELVEIDKYVVSIFSLVVMMVVLIGWVSVEIEGGTVEGVVEGVDGIAVVGLSVGSRMAAGW